jgi:hypothetical protein
MSVIPNKAERAVKLWAELKRVEDAGGPSPERSLACLAAGIDPRPSELKTVYALAQRYELTGLSEILDEIVQYILSMPEVFDNYWIAVKDQQKAAAELMKFLHSQMKAVDISGSVSTGSAIAAPFTEDDYRSLNEFERVFKNDGPAGKQEKKVNFKS